MKDYNIKLNRQFMITMGREYGSGGRTAAKMLAKALNIHYYDDEILKLASEQSAINEEIFRMADEQPGKNILNRITKNRQLELAQLNDIDKKNLTSPDNLFKFQSNVILDLSKEESFIILGRCANFILQEYCHEKVLRLYLYADFDKRVERIMAQESITKDEAIAKVKKKDKNRSEFYKYFTGSDIKDSNQYDMMLNTSTIGFDDIVDTVLYFFFFFGFISFIK